jgi:hypothetical protein
MLLPKGAPVCQAELCLDHRSAVKAYFGIG